MIETTIILPNYNNERVLPYTFEYLQTRNDCSKFNFVMVDDGSDDQSIVVAKREVMKCRFASVEIIEQPHKGIVHALNTALDAVTTEFVVRIDGDATVETSGWIALLLKSLRHQEVGMVGGQVIWESGRVHSFGRSVFSEYGLYDMGCSPLESVGRRTFDSLVYRPMSQFLDGPPCEVDTILGVCVAFRRDDANAVGRFDLRFNPVWIEDDDFGLALRQLGKRIILNPKVHVVHRPTLRGSRQPIDERKRQVSGSGKRSWFSRTKKSIMRRAFCAGRAFCGYTSQKPDIETLFPREADTWRVDILKSHYSKWKEKWGFDPLNPDMDDVFDRYWDTAFCWRCNPARLRESRLFIKRMTGEL